MSQYDWRRRMTWTAVGKCSEDDLQTIADEVADLGNALFAAWGKIGKSDSTERRLLVVRPYTITFFKQKFASKKIAEWRDYHMYEVKSVVMFSEDTVTFLFCDRSGKEQSLHFYMDSGVPMQLVSIVVRAHSRLCIGRTDIVLSAKVFSPQGVLEDVSRALAPDEIPPCGGFVEVYRARLLYEGLAVPTRDAVEDALVRTADALRAVGGSAQAENADRVIDFETIPGIMEGGKLQPAHFDCAAQALAHNTWFEGLYLQGVAAPRAGALLGAVMETNITVTEICAADTGCTAQSVVDMARSIFSNGNSALTSIDLSGNPIKDKGVGGLTNCVRYIPLTSLNLARCDVRARGIASLLEALEGAHHPDAGLKVLDLSGNPLGADGSIELARFLDKEKAARMEHIALKDCALELTSDKGRSLITSLKNLKFLSLLDLGENEMNASTAAELSRSLQSSSPVRVKLTKCKLDMNDMIGLLTSLLPTTRTVPLRIDLSNAVIGDNVRFLNDFLGRTDCGQLEALSVAHTQLESRGLIMICAGLARAPNLKLLDISFNIMPQDDCASAMLAVVDFVNSSRLTTLRMRGTEERNVGVHIIALLDALNSAHLEELDIEGNNFGNAGALAVCAFLKRSTIVSLNIDRNNIPMDAMRSLNTAVRANTCLCCLEMSVDARAAAKKMGTRKANLAELESVMKQIGDSLQTNRDRAAADAAAAAEAASRSRASAISSSSTKAQKVAGVSSAFSSKRPVSVLTPIEEGSQSTATVRTYTPHSSTGGRSSQLEAMRTVRDVKRRTQMPTLQDLMEADIMAQGPAGGNAASSSSGGGAGGGAGGASSSSSTLALPQRSRTSAKSRFSLQFDDRASQSFDPDDPNLPPTPAGPPPPIPVMDTGPTTGPAPDKKPKRLDKK